MQHATDTATAVTTSEDQAVLEGVRWCHEHGATVRWGADRPDGEATCVVEVLAPGTDWNLLRGRGDDFLEAMLDARAKHDAWAHQVAARRRPPSEIRRWSA